MTEKKKFFRLMRDENNHVLGFYIGRLPVFFGDDDFLDGCDSGPSVNIDGAPMCGSVDVHGRPYGVNH